MKTPILVCLFLLMSCYEEANPVLRDAECDAAPDMCAPDDKYNTCAEYGGPEIDPCGWYKCLQTIGQKNEWVESRRCLRHQCGIPFDEECFATYRGFLVDCFDNDCETEIDAYRCASWDEEARNVCG